MLNENTNIKEWYLREYANDELGKELVDDLTFRDLFEAMDNYEDVYETLFGDDMKGDSLIRERVFSGLAEVMHSDYETIYEQWLKCRG